jgi:hypothetical protein
MGSPVKVLLLKTPKVYRNERLGDNAKLTHKKYFYIAMKEFIFWDNLFTDEHF